MSRPIDDQDGPVAGAGDVPPAPAVLPDADPLAVPQAADVDTTPAAEVIAPAAVPVRRPGLNWRLVAVLVLADQVTKMLIRASISLHDSVTVIPGFLDLTHVRNPGVAFGLLSDVNAPLMPFFTAALAVLALVGIAYYARHIRPDERLARLGLSIILGGALGNLVDRFRDQYVLDFVDLYWGDWHFWAFNVADASITIGAILVFFELLTHRHASHPV